MVRFWHRRPIAWGQSRRTRSSADRQARRAGFVASCCGLLVACAVPSRALAEPSLFDEYALTSWTDEDGLFGGWIAGIAQDLDGYLWIGTVSGLIRFDGSRFERFRGTDGALLSHRSVASVSTDRDGNVWVGFGGGGGVYRIRGGEVRDYGPSDGLGGGRVTALIEDADGTILAAMRDGLYGLLNDRWERIGPAHGLPDGPISAVFRDRGGALWAATSEALFRRVSPQSMFERAGELDGAPQGISDSASGAVWITDPIIGYRPLDRPQRQASPMAGAPQANGYRLLGDRRGNLWLATQGQGLWFVRNGQGTPQIVGTYNGLSNDTVRTLFEDRNGDIWVGTTVGLHRFARRRVTPLTDLGVVRAVEADRAGDVWVGTADGLVRFTNGVAQWHRAESGLSNGEVRALHVDASGVLWVATAAGVARFDGRRFSPLRLEEGDWPVAIAALATDSRGNVWICTQDHGLFRWRNGRLTPVTLSAGIDRSSVYSVTTDRTGRVWVVLSGGGLGFMESDDSFVLLRSGDRFHQHDVAMYEDDKGVVWFGGGERLTRFADGQLSAITDAHGLPAEAIRAIAGDKDGNLWLGMSGGIIRFAETEFERALTDPHGHLDFRSYNASDGLAGMPIRTGYPNVARGLDGRLWFVTGNGVTIVDPALLSETRPAPAVRIERVTANGRSFDVKGPFELPPRTTNLQIEYTALEFFSPRQVEFHYRLEGLDDDWTEARSRRQASFTNLPPRSYRFRVIARSSEGVWNEVGDALEFSILPMFYQTGWFYGLCVMSALALVFLGWRLRLRHVRHEFALVLTERARMAREIHDTLLQSLAGLELQVDAMSSQLESSHGGVKQQLERVRKQIQLDVSEARQSIWDLRSPTLESRDLASALRELGETAVDSIGTQFQFSVSGQPLRCARKVEEHLLRVGREAVSNAVRHAQARVVHVGLHYDADSITLRVSDDGRGFDVTEATRPSGGHWGVATMHERAEAIGGRLTLVSQPGAGTNLEMVAPLLSSNP